MEHFCIITMSGFLICIKIILKNRLLDTSLLRNKKKRLLVTIRYDDMFISCIRAIAIDATIQSIAFSK